MTHPIITLLTDITAGPAGLNMVAVLFWALLAFGLVALAYEFISKE